MNRLLIASTVGLAFLVPMTASAQTFEQIAQARTICRQFGFQLTTESFANCVMQMTFRLESEDRRPGGEGPLAKLGRLEFTALFAAIKGISIAEAKEQLRKARGSSN